MFISYLTKNNLSEKGRIKQILKNPYGPELPNVCERKINLRYWILSGLSIWNVVVFLQTCYLNYSCIAGYPAFSLCWSTVPDPQQIQADDWSSRADWNG